MISGAYDFTQIQGRQKHFIVLLQETIVLVSVWGDFKRRLFQIVLHRVRCVCQGWRPTCRHWSKGFGVIEQAYRHFKKKRTVFFFTKYTHQRKKQDCSWLTSQLRWGSQTCLHPVNMSLAWSCIWMFFPVEWCCWQVQSDRQKTRFVDFLVIKTCFLKWDISVF